MIEPADDAPPSLTGLVMESLADTLHEHLANIAGEPLGFVLVVTDGTEVATVGNMPLDLVGMVLEKALEGAQLRQGDEG